MSAEFTPSARSLAAHRVLDRLREAERQRNLSVLTAALDAADLESVAEQAIIDHAREQLDMTVGEFIAARIRAAILGGAS